jgi:FkbM family methyltransferase
MDKVLSLERIGLSDRPGKTTVRPSMLAQFLLDRTLAVSRAMTVPHRRRKALAVTWRVYATLVRALGKHDLVRYRLYGHDLVMPAVSDLPSVYSRNPQYSENLGRIAKLVASKYPSSWAVDIGANIGDTAVVIVHHSQMRCLCIEGSATYYSFCRKNTAALNRVVAVNAMVGGASRTISGELVEDRGSAYIAEGPGIIKLSSLADLLDQHSEVQNVRLIKIDTDGYDAGIIAGAIDWIRVHQPVLFWECDPPADLRCGGPGSAIFATLVSSGYQSFLFYTNLGDYLLSCDGLDAPLIEDLFHFFSTRNGEQPRYMDVCAIPGHDRDLFTRLRALELS